METTTAPSSENVSTKTSFSKIVIFVVFIALLLCASYLGYQKGSVDASHTASEVRTQKKTIYIDSLTRSLPDSPGSLDFAVVAISPNGERQYIVDSVWEGYFDQPILYKDEKPYWGDFGIYRTEPLIFVKPDAQKEGKLKLSPTGAHLAVEGTAVDGLQFCSIPEDSRKEVQVIELNTARVLETSLSEEQAISYGLEGWTDATTLTVMARTHAVEKAPWKGDDSTEQCLGTVLSEEKKTLTISGDSIGE